MRSLYRHEAEPAIVPMELNAGIIEGHWTPWAARQMVMMTSLLPPQAGKKVFAEQGHDGAVEK